MCCCQATEFRTSNTLMTLKEPTRIKIYRGWQQHYKKKSGLNKSCFPLQRYTFRCTTQLPVYHIKNTHTHTHLHQRLTTPTFQCIQDKRDFASSKILFSVKIFIPVFRYHRVLKNKIQKQKNSQGSFSKIERTLTETK